MLTFVKVLAAGAAVVVAGWAVMHSALVVGWAGQARNEVMDRLGSRTTGDRYDEAVAFPSAPTAPLEPPVLSDPMGAPQTDYPEGLGTDRNAIQANGDTTVGGRR